MACVVRIEQPEKHTYGWQARGSWNRRRPRLRPTRFFADRRHGGRRRARAAAVAWIRRVGLR